MNSVCLIIEGTYPYMIGGVSTWVQTIISGLPHVDFSIVHLSVTDGKKRTVKFELPTNLKEIINVEIEGYQQPYQVAQWHPGPVALPRARVYHALSTGFAGILAGQIKQRTGCPFILTEHAIYWNEIAKGSLEVECGFQVIQRSSRMEVASLRRHWTTTFRRLARTAYSRADEIVTVCEANQCLQLAEGAEPGKCRVIPNGVPIGHIEGTKRSIFPMGNRPRIGLVGRVVPIKDIETFIRAAALIVSELPPAHFFVIGPIDQDVGYFRKCRNLVDRLGLVDRLTFTGALPRHECYALMDVAVLTSRVEAQPMVVLEAMDAGIPVVVTDVGGCRELVEGVRPDDKKLGSAGFVTAPNNPEFTAEAVVTLFRQPLLAANMGCVGRKRVAAFYGQEKCLATYGHLYDQYHRMVDDRSEVCA